jgi:RHS repeat-associated protein
MNGFRRALLAILACLIAAALIAGRPASAAVGSTTAAYGVTASGEVRYSIPIRATDGVAGLTPQLAITYVGPDVRTILGAGFQLSGLSYITPCRKTIAQDLNAAPILLQAGDRFCLDGARLRNVTGGYGDTNTSYQTELDQMVRATSYASTGSIPGWFKVETGDGLIHEYGNSPDSRLLAGTGGGAPPQFWAVNKISDRAGNYLTVTYDTDNTARRFRPNYIDYTAGNGGAAHYRIQFVYQPADQPGPSQDITPSAAGGGTHLETRLLDRIELKLDGTTYRQYLLTYETGAGSNTRLKQVQECAATISDCFPATVFAWQSATAGHGAAVAASTVGSWLIPLDLNGDGFEDVVWPSAQTGGTWRYMLGNASGYGSWVETGVAAINVDKALPLDWNGDGFMDLLFDWSDGKWRVLRGAATGFLSPVDAGPGGIPSNWIGSHWWMADLDGDGRDDLLRATTGAPATMYVRLNSASGFGGETLAFSDGNLKMLANPFGTVAAYNQSAVRDPDFNGDGRTDLLLYMCIWNPELNQCIGVNRWFYLVSNGTSFTNYGNIGGATFAVSPWTADFNNDGLTDIAFPSSSPAKWCVAMAQGGGGMLSTCGPNTSGYDMWGGMTGDWDADGYADLYVYKTATLLWDVYRGTGTGISSTPIATGISTSGATGWRITDFNGDGLLDLGRWDTPSMTWRGIPHAGVPGERLLSATDGLGNVVSCSYLPMTSSTVYTKGTGAPYPNRDLQTTTPLVRTLQVAPAGGTAFTMTYSYASARVHNQGRSFLGMETRTVTDNRNGAYVIETYRQDFPFIGAVASATVKQPSGTPISATSHSYAYHTLTMTPGNQRYLPYRSQSVTSRYEVGGIKNGNEITRITESRTVNTSGNTTVLTVSTVDKDPGSPTPDALYTTEITSAYLENGLNWCLPVPTSRSEKRWLPDLTYETRTSNWTVDAPLCRVTKEIIELSGGPDVSLTTDIDYDTCGNADFISSYPSADSAQARTTAINHGTRCQRPEIITNPLTQNIVIAYDWRFAAPISQTDPNGLASSTEYDTFGRVFRIVQPDGTAMQFDLATCSAGNGWCGKDSSVRYKLTQTARAPMPGNSVLRTDEQYLNGAGHVRFSQGDSLESGPAIVETVYDAFSRPQSRSQPYFQGAGSVFWHQLEYDLIGRLSEQDSPIHEGSPSGRVTAIAYEGLNVKITDPRGNITTRGFSAIGQLRSIVDPAPGGTTTYAYRHFGELASVKDAALNESTWNYNARGFLTQTTDPDSGTWTYEHNAFGEMTKVRDAKTTAPAWTQTYTYDKLSRPWTRVDTPEGTTTWTWGTSAAAKNIGQLESISSPGGYVEQYSFDIKGRPSQQTITADGLTYQFDESYDATTGLLASLEYPTSTGSRLKVAYEYQSNLLRRVKQFGSGPTFWEVTSTDAYGHIQDETFGNGVITSTDFDQASGLMDSRQGGLGGGAGLINATTDWDLNGNLIQRQDLQQVPNVTEVFEYDTLNRLDRSTRNGVQNLDVALNAIGNITSKTVVGAYDYTTAQAGCSYYAHPQPRAVRKTGASTVYCYDKNGNMTKRAGSNISYTSYNLPSVINSGSNSSTISYGAYRNRYKQVAVTSGVTETTIYVGGLLEKATKSGVTEYRHLIQGGNGLAAIHTRRTSGSPLSETFYVHNDHLGSPELITKQNGTARVRLSFGGYGERRDKDWDGAVPSGDMTTIGNTTRHGFTDHEHLDAVGLVHMNGRVYDPKIGRFLGADPLLLLGLSQDVNAYAYVANNPLTFIDPSGLTTERGDLQCETEDCDEDWWDWRDLTDWAWFNDTWDFRVRREQVRPRNHPRPAAGASASWDGGISVTDAIGATVKVYQWWNAESTATVCDVACAKGGTTPTTNTATNGQRVTNVVLGMSMFVPVGAAEGPVALAATGASSAMNAVRLERQLASAAQVGEILAGRFRVIAGAGVRRRVDDVARLVQQYGGKVTDWAKVTSSAFRSRVGEVIETHAYRNVVTGEVVELKSVITASAR